jgi:hypothetical protein
MREVCEGPEIKELAEQQARLAEEMAELNEKIATTDRLLGVNWEAVFDQVRAENSKAIERTAREKAEALVKDLTGALDEWYSTDANLADLTARHWNPILTRAARDLAEASRSRLRSLLGGQLGGAEPAAAVMTDLHAIDFPLSPSATVAAAALNAAESADAYALELKGEQVPVKKSFGDWILFRGLANVRRRLFGEDLQQTIAPELKQKRLPVETTRAALLEFVSASVRERFPDWPVKFATALANAYAGKFRQSIIERLRQQRDEFAMANAQRQGPHDTITAILNAMKALDEQSSKSVAEIILMAQQETGETLEAPGATAIAAEAEPASAA